MDEQISKPKRNPNGGGWYVENADGTVTNKKYYYDAHGERYLKSFRAKNKTAARKMREQWEYEHSYSAQKVVVESMPVDKYMEQYLETYKKNSVAEITYDTMQDCLNSRVRGYDLASYQMHQVTPKIIQSHVDALVESGYSKATITKTMTTIRGCFEKAYYNGDITSNPMVGIEMPSERNVKKKAKKIQFYPPEDIDKIYNEAIKKFSNGKYVYHYGMVIILMMFTGVRIGEMLGLKWKCVDLDAKTIKIENSITRIKTREDDIENKITYKDSMPKSKSAYRIVPLSQKAVFALTELRNFDKGHTDPEDYVAQSEAHRLASERNIRRCLHLIEDNAGTSVRNAGLHVLRHTFATYAIYKGMDVITLSKILGHNKPSVTQDIYVDVLERQKVSAVDLLDS